MVHFPQQEEDEIFSSSLTNHNLRRKEHALDNHSSYSITKVPSFPPVVFLWSSGVTSLTSKQLAKFLFSANFLVCFDLHPFHRFLSFSSS
jgi:hypothetical protein